MKTLLTTALLLTSILTLLADTDSKPYFIARNTWVTSTFCERIANADSTWRIYPNPFDTQTNITIPVDKGDIVSLTVYDFRGNIVAGTFELTTDSSHTQTLIGDTLKPGLFFVQLMVNGYKQLQKIIVFSTPVSNVKFLTTITVRDSKIKEGNIAVYANPSNTGVFNLEFSSKRSDVAITLTNATGQVLSVMHYQKQASILRTQIDLSKRNKGFYFLRIQTENESVVQKIINL